MKAIILAAGRGKRIKKLTLKPKCLLEFSGLPLICHYIYSLNALGIKKIVLVVGYKGEEIIKTLKKYCLKVRVIRNNAFSEGSILSVWAAKKELNGNILLMDADIYFEKEILKRLIQSNKNNFFMIDTQVNNDNEAVMVGFKNNRAVALGRGLKGDYEILGEWAGFLRLSSFAANKLNKLIEERVASGERKLGYEFIVPYLFSKICISYELINGLKWVEIDSPKDFKKALSLCKS